MVVELCTGGRVRMLAKGSRGGGRPLTEGGRPWWRAAMMEGGNDGGRPWWRAAVAEGGHEGGRPWRRAAVMEGGHEGW